MVRSSQLLLTCCCSLVLADQNMLDLVLLSEEASDLIDDQDKSQFNAAVDNIKADVHELHRFREEFKTKRRDQRANRERIGEHVVHSFVAVGSGRAVCTRPFPA